jgi:hypothetical protein
VRRAAKRKRCTFVCFADESRECWTVENKNVRAQDNITAGRMPKPPPETAPH